MLAIEPLSIASFFKEINWDGSLHVSGDTAVPGTFLLPKSHCVSILWTVILTQAHNGKSIFSPFVNIF